MERKILNYWLMGLLAVSVAVGTASCKDDDDASQDSVEQRELDEAAQADKFWRVAGQLVGISQATDDYRSKTFEPTIGTPKDDDATVRIIATNDAETAAERFASLVGLTADDGSAIDETTPSYTWSDPAVGTLTYTKTQDGTSLATVDVSIRQIPSLRQLVYMTPEQMGLNAEYSTCYYRFGDVIKRTRRDHVAEYWICVRPSFQPEGKGESHWISVSPLPAENIETYAASNGNTYTMPTKISDNSEQMQNLAEMLYAINAPDDWADNIGRNPKTLFSKGIRMFHDFDKKKIDYHSAAFWKRVDDMWMNPVGGVKDMWMLLFGLEKSDFYDMIEKNGLHLMYDGYSWKWSISNDLTLYERVYTNGSKTESNMHKVKKSSITRQVVNKRNHDDDIHFDVLHQYTVAKPYLDNADLTSQSGRKFFDDDACHYIVRNATGAELCKMGGGQYDPKTPITNCEDVYVYNKIYNKDLTKRPETSADILPVYGEYGSICPGTIIQDASGDKWLCYASWYDKEEIGTTADHKARFISLDGLTVSRENIRGTNKPGTFVDNADLVPERWAPVVACVLSQYCQKDGDGASPALVDLRQRVKDAFNVDLSDYEVRRDAYMDYEGERLFGNQEAINIAYEPEGGRLIGTQPYLRFILDSSGLNGRNVLEDWMKYPRLWFFKKYNDGGGRTLDLTHPFLDAGFVTADSPFKADEFSSKVLTDTKQSEGDFTVNNCYTEAFDARLFNSSPSIFKTPYHEPVLVLRHLAFDDPSGDFRGVYEGDPYTIVSKPDDSHAMSLRFGVGVSVLQNANNPGQFPWCLMDGEKFDVGFFTKLPPTPRTGH